jgi:hypothetical protein
MVVKKGNISVGIALSGDEGIETKEKKKESIAEKNERKGEEADKIQKEEEGALIGLGIMFSEDGKD